MLCVNGNLSTVCIIFGNFNKNTGIMKKILTNTIKVIIDNGLVDIYKDEDTKEKHFNSL